MTTLLFLIANSFFNFGCYFKASISDIFISQSNTSNYTQPEPTSSLTATLTLAPPSYQIYDDSTPSFEASNFTYGHTLKLYRDNNCSTEVASTTVAANPQSITVSSALADGVYQFSARSFDVSNASSSCIVFSGNYELNTQAPVLATITPTTLPTFTGGQLTIEGSQFVMGTTVSFVRTDGEEFICQSAQLVNTSQITCTAPGFNEASVSVKVVKPVTALQTILINSLTYLAPLPTAPVCFNGSVSAIANNAATYIGGSFTSGNVKKIVSP